MGASCSGVSRPAWLSYFYRDKRTDGGTGGHGHLVVAFGSGNFGGFHKSKLDRARTRGAIGRGQLVGQGVSSSMAAAGVPSRREYGNTWIFAKPTWRAKAQVSSKSSSVSPGKPTMMSVVSAISGTMARR